MQVIRKRRSVVARMSVAYEGSSGGGGNGNGNGNGKGVAVVRFQRKGSHC